MYSPALESIQNINVVTNSFDAEQALAGGAAVTVTTKSGTNAIHSSAFEYHTDQHLQADPWAANRTQPKPKYISNQFGGTIVLNVLTGRTAITDGIGTEGTNKYDSLQARIEHPFVQKFQFSASYTFAKGLGYSTQVSIPSDFGLNYGNLAGIARNTLGLAFVVQSPFGKGKRWLESGFGGKLLGNWQIEAISTIRGGTPFTITASKHDIECRRFHPVRKLYQRGSAARQYMSGITLRFRATGGGPVWDMRHEQRLGAGAGQSGYRSGSDLFPY